MSEDFRYKRTERHIRDAFLQLLRSKRYEKITVNNIAELAEISRNAFYSHYYSKEELLHSLMDAVIKKCNENQDKVFGKTDVYDDTVAKEILIASITPLYEDEGLTRLFFKVNGGELFSRRLAKALAEYQFERSNKSSLTPKQSRDLKLYCDYRASGVVGVIRNNFISEEPYSQEELIELLYTIGTGGGNRMLDPISNDN